MIIGIQDEILKLNQEGLLDILLRDMTTKSNIIWGTDAYSSLGEGYYKEDEIRAYLITGDNSHIIRNRVRKDLEQQSERTKAHAEVFTPFWICKLMIDYIDKAWLGVRTAGFPEEEIDLDSNPIWDVVGDDNWQDYVNSQRMELTCGEAPYLVTRYDVSSGDTIPMSERTGVLDRKLAVVGMHTKDRSGWMKWALRALTSTYGYEFQGDNLLIARLNLLMSFSEFYEEKFKRKLLHKDLEKAAEIIVWNVWQMDGLTDKVPYSYNGKAQIDFFDLLGDDAPQKDGQSDKERFYYCVIRDWGKNSKTEPIEINFSELKRRDKKMFDYIIGNPPYHEETENTSDKPIYDLFMTSTFKLANKVELITPARFLFGAGKTSSKFTEEVLNDSHFKVLKHFSKSTEAFPGIDLTGGVAISYRDNNKNFGAIGAYTAFTELETIKQKVIDYGNFYAFSNIIYAPESYKFTSKFHSDNPSAKEKLSNGHENDLTTNIFKKLDGIFLKNKPSNLNEYVCMCGLLGNSREFRYVRKDYIKGPDNFSSYKVLLPKSNGSGAIGEGVNTQLIGEPLACEPYVGHTQTFLSIGSFETSFESRACLKYVKTRFARSLLGILKVTQHNPSRTWRYVPNQDFSESSDIDWTKSVADIDRQLYAKYGLTNEEISFIEEKITAME